MSTDDDKTVFVTSSSTRRDPDALAVEVTYAPEPGTERTVRFTEGFRIGRGASCGLHLAGDTVSREHAEIYWEGERCWIKDLESANGTFLNGKRVDRAQLGREGRVQLGAEGPILNVTVFGAAAEAERPSSMTEVVRHYFEGGSDGQEAGEHTMMVRKAFQKVSRQQKRHYWKWIAAAGFLFVVAAGIAGYQWHRAERLKGLAVEIFYNMKSIELQLGQLRTTMGASATPEQRAQLAAKQEELKKMRRRYDRFVSESGLVDDDLSPQDRAIYRMARVFGECEINMPPGFVDEVKEYIHRWKTTDRLERAIGRLQRHDYGPIVYREMLANNLPPQFLYLALQESDFRVRAVGPKTRYGIAKGMWQFIPDTAVRYDLETGPLVEMRRYDPRDQRFTVEASTRAAARYLGDIYNSEAQASGLLVIASYNWGHNRVRRLIRKMPENPRDRNFWNLMKHYDVPRETRDYVFYIFSAAVIGENPELFGFDFDNPLGNLEEQTPAVPAGEPISFGGGASRPGDVGRSWFQQHT